MNFQVVALLFFMYSFIGWIIEELDILIEYKKLTYRGFLIGPICPIYGISALLMIFVLSRYQESAFMVFCSAFFICSIIEYLTSYFLEKIFHVRWWDYSHMKFNLNGRVSLRNSIFFGAAGVLLIYFVNPWVLKIIDIINGDLVVKLTYVLLGLFIMDVIVSCNVLFNLKKVFALDEISLRNKINSALNKDNTVEVSKAVRDKIASISILHTKILKGFPKMKLIRNSKKK